MKKIIIFLTFLLLTSCGYKPVFSSKNSNFSIEEIIHNENDRISIKIKKGLGYLTSLENYEEIIKLQLKSDKEITISSKNTKGDPLVYKMTIISEIKIYSNDKLIKEKNISKKFSYNNISNKFDLKQYEKIIEQNLVEKIKEDIVLILYNR